MVSTAYDYPLGLCPFEASLFGVLWPCLQVGVRFWFELEIVGIMAQKSFPITWHPISHYVIEIFYIMEIILFAYFGLKIFFPLKRWDLVVKILWWLRFPYPSPSWSLYKGHNSYFLNTLPREIPCVFYSFLPSLVRESLWVVISNRSSEINLVLFHIVDWMCSSPYVVFSRIGFPRKSCVLYCSCYRCLLLIIIIYPNSSTISLL